MSIRLRLQDFVRGNPGVDARILAKKALRKITRLEILGLLIIEIRHQQRLETHKKEETSALDLILTGRSPASVSQVRDFLHATFSLGDGRQVTWGEATIEEHQTRIENLQKHVKAVSETILRHEKAVRRLKKHKVTCLNELGEDNE